MFEAYWQTLEAHVIICILLTEQMNKSNNSFTILSNSVNVVTPEAEFLDVTGTKDLSVFLLAIHSHLYRILLPPPLWENVVLKM